MNKAIIGSILTLGIGWFFIETISFFISPNAEFTLSLLIFQFVAYSIVIFVFYNFLKKYTTLKNARIISVILYLLIMVPMAMDYFG